MSRPPRASLWLALLILGCRARPAATPAPPPAPARPPPPASEIDGNATDFFAPPALGRLSPGERAAWQGYLARSAKLRAADRASMDAELRAAGLAAMFAGPYRKAFRVEPSMTDAWFAAPDAVRIADNVVSFQVPSGGWSKRTEVLERARRPGESYYSENAHWSYIGTIDNDSTTEELRFLARAYAAHREARHLAALLRGLDYLLAAQYPNGCWPQVYPLAGGYHDAATYNDDAIVNVMRLLGEVAAGRFEGVPRETQQRAAAAVARGLDCIVASQVVVAGTRTVWAQQHDPLTLAPVSARTYELRALCGRESSNVASYLMTLPDPDARVVEAVHAAAAWFRAHEIFGYEYDSYGLRAAPGAGPLWARLTEIETDRPIFSNRDGVRRYDWNELTDRRRGYTWYSKEPAAMLERYDEWSRSHSRAAARP
jgi:PelA/Pel-15E family pectate lyase